MIGALLASSHGWLTLLLGCAADVDSAEPASPWPEEEVPEGPAVPVSGLALGFGPGGGRLVGAEVWVVELPEQRTWTDDQGAFAFEGLPRGEVLSFGLAHPDAVAVQTGSFRMGAALDGGDALEGLTFQAPDPAIFALMAEATEVNPDPELCQVATTVTRRGHDLFGGGTHGEPGATATLGPDAEREAGPIYFDLVSVDFIFPNPELTETTDDGGVLWANVAPGDYLLEGHKEGARVRPVKIRCRPGVLVNASPPWGLQVLEGGLEPDP